ncbi:hypothetical protein A2767_01475 [Candidatus Roizmanbacteria bacterium RIFCSPHIGHO2_01_FULL_35_10]|uniref:Uncharacterized protein n=1 Tax=Candidatus Roizmanbacteria bacterium RIFCSPLOWO2_01_FULL_35_13 TaxID=1802055 RepID=A0A1F7IAV8_9BACT|nr:MAG: hypothetical protein A2767_01475 [Candidatus Roizmanbacteria bacterium RIFCSPHIGHO2_01_FULL_35_10]OGK40503.1 MAG: hypothetical protein A3A74_02840 [Candidatus Roizmanbacteria bacterium RIFCSPLOWO2_01_FULL_35_13]
MTVRPDLSADVNKRFTEWQAYRPKGAAIAVETQEAIKNVTQALQGIIPEEKVKAAIGNASNPNAVSRAVRGRLPPL